MDLVEVREGETAFFAPVQDEDRAFPPGTASIFFNRRMELNRDATSLLVSVIRPRHYLDAMGATGVRGLRIARECGVPVTINDRNPDAISLIEKNAGPDRDLIEITRSDANVLMSGRRFDAIDIDPFGTPAYFVDAAARSAERFLFLTATDTAPLCGAHLKAGMRRYFALPRNTEYHSEVGLRVLLGFAAREIVKYDRGIEPLFCFSREHFVRLHLCLTNNATAADRSMKQIGYVLQCPECPFRAEERGLLPSICSCRVCGAELVPIGPLWLGPVNNRTVLSHMLDQIGSMRLGTSTHLSRLLALCLDEIDLASFYDYHILAKRWQVSPPRIESLLERLRDMGHAASRTHHTGTGFKTDAPIEEIKTALTHG
jgi:tRNA (guanine26-N2/guanine27-N2)-dimethyltransferase